MLSSCSMLSRVQALMHLDEFSKERDAQEKILNEQNGKYEHLERLYLENGGLVHPLVQWEFEEQFGAPLFIRQFTSEGSDFVEWLYRNPNKPFNSSKIYVYFDSAGQFHNWRHIAGTK